MAQLLNRCDPAAANPCWRDPPAPLFKTGLSIRQIRLCPTGPRGPNVCDCPAPSYGRMRIGMGNTIDRSRWLEGWAYSQLVTRGEVGCQHSPTGRREGGWWADAFRQGMGTAAAFRSGSKLWSLQGRIVNNTLLMRAKAYALEALEYLQTWGIVTRIQIEATYISRHVMQLSVRLWGPGNVQAIVTVSGQSLPAGSWAWSK